MAKKLHSIALAVAMGATAAVAVTGCSTSTNVKGIVTKVVYKPGSAMDGPTWTAAIREGNGTVIALTTASDEDALAAKVTVGACVIASIDSGGNVGNQSNVQVVAASQCR